MLLRSIRRPPATRAPKIAPRGVPCLRACLRVTNKGECSPRSIIRSDYQQGVSSSIPFRVLSSHLPAWENPRFLAAILCSNRRQPDAVLEIIKIAAGGNPPAIPTAPQFNIEYLLAKMKNVFLPETMLFYCGSCSIDFVTFGGRSS